MTDITVELPIQESQAHPLQKPLLLALLLLALALVFGTLGSFGWFELEQDALVESTLGRLAIWMADQSGNDPDEILSPLAHYAENWANQLGMEELDPELLFTGIRNLRAIYYFIIVMLLVVALASIFLRPNLIQKTCFIVLLMLDALLFFIPSLEGNNAVFLLAAAILVVLLALVASPGKVSRALGFFLALSFLLLGWEASKAFADSVKYKILLPQPSWQVKALPSMDEALDALRGGAVDFVIADRKDLNDLMPPHPPDDDDTSELPYQDLRYMGAVGSERGCRYLAHRAGISRATACRGPFRRCS